MKIGSLFSGVGGLELGLERAGVGHVVWQVEQDAYCRGVLARHWPEAVRHEDVRSVGAGLERVDLICGGFPCVDISLAGKGAGIDGAQSGLWAEYARVVGELRPRFVVIENVVALRKRGLDRVLGDLAACGYDALWFDLQAADVGAPHRRSRLFVVAWRASDADGEPVRLEQQRRPDGRRGEYATKRNPSLESWAKMWPTATAGDAKRSGSRGAKGLEGNTAHEGTSLTDATCRSGRPLPTTCTHGGECRLRLNPQFVEWLMGFPLGWTEPGCDLSATPSSPTAPRSSATSCLESQGE